MVTRNLSRLVIALGLGLLGTACTQDESKSTTMTHYTARRQVTGSNVPRAAAYGDGVDDSVNTRNTMNQMSAGASASVTGSGGGAR